MQNKRPEKRDFFLAFLRKKISDGEKQVDIANSKEVDKSPAYINKLYNKNPKSVPIRVQEGVAQYFGLDYEEMIAEGESIFFKSEQGASQNIKKTNDKLRRMLDEAESTLDELSLTSSTIIKNAENIRHILNVLGDEATEKSGFEKAKQEIEVYRAIFDNLVEGVTFFNPQRELVYSSNRYGLLTGINTEKKPSLEVIVLTMRKMVVNFEQVLETIMFVHTHKKKQEIEVNFHNGAIFRFQIVPLFKADEFLGTLIINTPVKPPEPA